jgi:hypothetical protein
MTGERYRPSRVSTSPSLLGLVSISQVVVQAIKALPTNFDGLVLHIFALYEFSATEGRLEGAGKRTMSTDLICAAGRMLAVEVALLQLLHSRSGLSFFSVDDMMLVKLTR